jgi:hypothetical protein
MTVIIKDADLLKGLGAGGVQDLQESARHESAQQVAEHVTRTTGIKTYAKVNESGDIEVKRLLIG